MSMMPPLRYCRDHYVGECVPKLNYQLLFDAYMALSAVARRIGCCSRCTRPIEGFEAPGDGATAGYYVATADNWRKYANPGEVYICDACMWADPRYVGDYGTNAVSPPSTDGPQV